MEARNPPRILGVFSLRKDQNLGYAGTARQGRSLTYWFAVQCAPERYALHALGADFLPTPVKTRAGREQFLADYAPETDTYTGQVLPRLRKRLAALGLFPTPEPNAVQAHGKELAALGLDCGGPDQTLALLASLAGELGRKPEEAAWAQSSVLTEMAIGQRKLNLLHEALDSCRKALALSPDDDHLHFNLARIFFDLQDWQNALAHAAKALDLNPGLDYARKMMAFIRRKEAKASA